MAEMLHGQSPLEVYFFNRLLISFLVGFLLQVHLAHSVVVPASGCYVLDNGSYIYDFTGWIGHPFEYDGEEVDLVVRFCKDVEVRSQKGGYVDYGRFSASNYFVAGSGHVNFIQEFYNGDLAACEYSYDKMGRTAQVNIICGHCPNGQCKGDLGCICNATYDSTMCRAFVELAIPCGKNGSRVFEGFTIGFHPRSWEVVYNGLTQLGYEKARHEFSFGTEQTDVSLYMTAVSSLSALVSKPVFEVNPKKGLEVKLSGSGAKGSPPTTLSPTILLVSWRCEVARDTPYEVTISIPVKGYNPIEFTLTKICAVAFIPIMCPIWQWRPDMEQKQDREGDALRGWATFGILSCVFIVLSTVCCCGGFIYKTRVEHQHGLDAVPGMTILSACLDTVSGGAGGYSQVENLNSTFVNQTSWEHVPNSSQGTQRTNQRNYGSI